MIDALGADDKAAAVILKHQLFGAKIPERKQQTFARKAHDIFHIQQRQCAKIWIRAALAVKQTQHADADLGLRIDSIREFFPQEYRERAGRAKFELPVIFLAL